ncbi:MAG: hypothetical protein JW816_02435 [Candidatus Buchananbacteria bacterium]|nr:hypothetical protein [Candidatus Buchananbacteria bacterium]
MSEEKMGSSERELRLGGMIFGLFGLLFYASLRNNYGLLSIFFIPGLAVGEIFCVGLTGVVICLLARALLGFIAPNCSFFRVLAVAGLAGFLADCAFLTLALNKSISQAPVIDLLSTFVVGGVFGALGCLAFEVIFE